MYRLRLAALHPSAGADDSGSEGGTPPPAVRPRGKGGKRGGVTSAAAAFALLEEEEGSAGGNEASGGEEEGEEGHASVSGPVIAKVVSVTRHPGSDRLRVAVVDAGDAVGSVQVVTNATEVGVGQCVALAPAGSTTPGSGVDIAETEVRGVRSVGMLCSAHDLGWASEPDGALVLLSEAVFSAGDAVPAERPSTGLLAADGTRQSRSKKEKKEKKGKKNEALDTVEDVEAPGGAASGGDAGVGALQKSKSKGASPGLSHAFAGAHGVSFIDWGEGGVLVSCQAGEPVGLAGVGRRTGDGAVVLP